MNLSTSAFTFSHRSNGTAAPVGGGQATAEQKQSQQQQQHHHLTPQEAALRGASLAFQKQQQGSNSNAAALARQATGSVGGGSRISRQNTGASAVSRHPTGSSIRSQRDYADEAAGRERERERKALFLSPATPDGGRSASNLLLRPAASPTGLEGKSASFIAATLAASRSVSPGQAGLENGGGGGSVGAAGLASRRSLLLREPVDLGRRGSATSSTGTEERTDTTSLAPAMSLISLFEKRRDSDEVPGSPGRSITRKPKSRSPSKPQLSNGAQDGQLERESLVSKSKAAPSPKPKPRIDVDDSRTHGSPTRESKLRSTIPQQEFEMEGEKMGSKNNEPESRPKPNPKPKANAVTRPETPPPPVVRRADTVIVSPKPRRPETKPRLETSASLMNNANENSTVSIEKKAKAKPKISRPEPIDPDPRPTANSTNSGLQASQQRRPRVPLKSPVISVKTRPPAPRKSSGLSERLSPELKRRNTQRRSVVAKHDGQEESKLWTGIDQDAEETRPTTSDSKSSNDSFVSASSVLSREDTDSLLTVEAPSSRSITPKAPTSRPASTQPPTLPMRRSVTGSSQLPLDSLSDAIMAGSLASARHTPISVTDSRTPPPLPPSRRKGGHTASKVKSSSRRPSPHRMKHTLRQPKSHSDDEDARRPHHKKGLNHKKHAHHEGSRSRWREEITEREKKRYEAVWASNRGALLVASLQTQILACSDPARHPESHQRPRKPLRNESYEELSEHVANVVVRDVWQRSRLPKPELAEVWDLVYGHGRAHNPEPGGLLHGALNKQEFVVGMWLIDQRLRGRKIPPRVGESVWDSATGLRVLNPTQGHGHGLHKGKGRGK